MEQNLETKTPNADFQDIREIQKFNWGALFFWWIWGIFNGAFKQTFIPFIILLVVSFIPIINLCVIFASVGIMVYFGLNGNQWAWEGKTWNSTEHFNSIQKRWAIGGTVLGTTAIMFLILSVFATITTLKAMNNYITEDYKTDNYISTINLSSELKYSPDSKTLTSNMISSLKTVNNKTQNHELYNENTISVKTYDKTTGKIATNELYSFVKKGKECSLKKKNCYIVKYEIQGTKAVPERKTFFDSNGKTNVIIMKK